MRLIDADVILSYIDHVLHNGLGKGKSLEYIMKFIKKTPTAYDVETVVQQLEKEMECAEKEMQECTFKAMPFYDTQKGYATAMHNAIEIVRNGGVK